MVTSVPRIALHMLAGTSSRSNKARGAMDAAAGWALAAVCCSVHRPRLLLLPAVATAVRIGFGFCGNRMHASGADQRASGAAAARGESLRYESLVEQALSQ
jgi:hypothetical protein